MEVSSIPVMGYQVYRNRLEDLAFPKDQQIIINTLNAYSYVVAVRDAGFRQALTSSNVLIADGFPVVMAARFLQGKKIYKIAGNDIFHHLLKQLNAEGGRCFFLGSSEATLQKIGENLKKDYPNVEYGLHSPPYKPVFSDDDNTKMQEAVRSFSPDVLFVGMTAPKQEKWVNQNKELLEAGVICSIGAVFDFYAGTVKRPSAFWIAMRMEWFIRFVKEPKRLWKRYFVYSPLFFIHMFRFRFKRAAA